MITGGLSGGGSELVTSCVVVAVEVALFPSPPKPSLPKAEATKRITKINPQGLVGFAFGLSFLKSFFGSAIKLDAS